MAKKKLTKEQKKLQYAQAMSANGNRENPYYPNDPKVGMYNKNREVKPMVPQIPLMSVKDWVKTIIIACIPLINIIAFFAWANKNNGKVNPAKRNFAKACLWILFTILCIAIVAVVLVLIVLPLLGITLM